MPLICRPLSFAEAREHILTHHRHHKPPLSHKFSIGAEKDGALVGVAVVGRPVARRLDDGWTAEVTRLCTDGTKNACSLLYAAAARAAGAMGYRRIVTYILEAEHGVSVRAAGWKFEIETPGKSWSVPSRQREDKHPLGKKHRYGKTLNSAPPEPEKVEW